MPKCGKFGAASTAGWGAGAAIFIESCSTQTYFAPWVFAAVCKFIAQQRIDAEK